VCARVSAHEYQALDLEILTGFAQGAFDCLEREREENRTLRERLEKAHDNLDALSAHGNAAAHRGDA
jgi:hypothetical protein